MTCMIETDLQKRLTKKLEQIAAKSTLNGILAKNKQEPAGKRLFLVLTLFVTICVACWGVKN